MITLNSKNAIALLVLVMKQNYGKSWFTREEDGLAVGIHSPNGEIAYRIPAEYASHFKGMIEVPKSDALDKATESDSADRLLEWAKTL